MLRRIHLFVLLLLAAVPMWAGSTTVVISQLYGAGGNSGATYNADYVELLNISSSPVSITGWALQYGSATGTTISAVSPIVGTITLQPGQRYLLSATPGTVGSALSPAADQVISTIAFGASAGRVFLTNNSTQLASSCPGAGGTVVDFIGYGTTTTCFEGTTFAPAPSTTLADIRVGNGCTDTDQNGSDFTAAVASPRSSTSTLTPCIAAPVSLALAAAINPATVNTGSSTLLTATVTPATSPASTGLVVTADTSALGGTTTQALYDDGTHGDLTAGDGTYSYTLAVSSSQAANTYTVNFKVSDTQLRSATASATVTVQLSNVAYSNVVLTASPTSIVAGASVTFSASVTGNQSAKPGGTVTFKDGTNSIGTGTITAGLATLSVTTLGVGTHTITAVYGGDGTYPAFTSSAVTVSVTAAPVADFTLSVANTSINVSSGVQKGQTTVNVAMVNGYSQTVSFSCSGLPGGSSCRFSPASLSASGSSTLYVAVDGASASLHRGRTFAGDTAFALGLLGLPLLLRRRLRKRLAGAVLGVLLIGTMLAGLSGCAGSTQTSSGSSTITVTAAGGSVSHTATFLLNVQ